MPQRWPSVFVVVRQQNPRQTLEDPRQQETADEQNDRRRDHTARKRVGHSRTRPNTVDREHHQRERKRPDDDPAGDSGKGTDEASKVDELMRNKNPHVVLLLAREQPDQYATWLRDAGAQVRVLGEEDAERQLAAADAFVLSGSFVDIDPSLSM